MHRLRFVFVFYLQKLKLLLNFLFDRDLAAERFAFVAPFSVESLSYFHSLFK